MTRLEIGQPFLDRRGRRTPGVQLSLSGSTAELHLILESPSAQEISAIKSDPASFGVFETDELLFFLYRFGGAFPWSDTPYHVALEQRFRPVKLELLTKEGRALLSMILVDARNGIVRALRVVTLTPEVTRTLWQAMLLQNSLPHNYDAQLEQIYASTSSQQMAALGVTGAGGT